MQAPSSTPVIDADERPRHAPTIDRRAIGYGLVLFALVAALCVPGLVGRRSTGVAAAAPPAPPPTVGQCVAPIQKPADLDRLAGAPVVDCVTAHSAEIVFVGQFPGDATYPEQPTSPSLADPRRACTLQVQQFTGTRGTPTSVIGQKGAQIPHTRPQVAAVVTVPIRHQWESGQHWYACLVRPAGDTLPMTYTGSVHQAMWAQTLPAAFARCAQVIGGDTVPCTEPHYAEQLTDFVDSRTPLDCAAAATSVIGAPDPTFGRAISLTGWQESGHRMACWATSTTGSAFVGTLIGLGNHPLPSA